MADQVDRLHWSERRPDTEGARISAEDCERQAMPAAAHSLRELADYIDALPADPQGAVSLLDDLADVLAEVSRYELAADDSRVREVLHRAAVHANGVTPPSVITARADVDLVDRMRRELALGTDEIQDGGEAHG